jgi:hypothetical protein
VNTQVSFHSDLNNPHISKVGGHVFFAGETTLCASLKFHSPNVKHDYVEVVQYSGDKYALIGWLEAVIEEASQAIKNIESIKAEADLRILDLKKIAPPLVNVDSQS